MGMITWRREKRQQQQLQEDLASLALTATFISNLLWWSLTEEIAQGHFPGAVSDERFLATPKGRAELVVAWVNNCDQPPSRQRRAIRLPRMTFEVRLFPTYGIYLALPPAVARFIQLGVPDGTVEHLFPELQY